MSFGFSIGDFLAAGTLITDIVTCLNASGGAASEYQELMRELDGLQRVLDKIEHFKTTPNRTESINSIKVAALNCAYILSDFKTKLEKYEGLGSEKQRRSSKSKAYMVRWELFMKEDVQTLRAYLQMHTSSLNARLSIEAIETAAATEAEAKVRHQSIDQKLEESNLAVRLLDIKVSSLAQEQKNHEERKKVLEWFSSSIVYDKQRDIFSKHQDGTGIWLLEHETFLQWMNGNQSDHVLWCPGHPGAGKTIMSALVVNHLQNIYEDQNIGIAFVYCDYKEEQLATRFLSSIIRQLSDKHEAFSLANEFFKKYTSSSGDKSSPTFQQLERLLAKICGVFDQVFIIIDALDECNLVEERDLILNTVNEILKSSIRVFITSRPNLEDINTQLRIHPQIEIVAAELDIEVYLRQKIRANGPFKRRIFAVAGLEDKIIEGIATRASGMFLMAVLQLERVWTERVPNKIVKALQTLPAKLESTYEATLERIQKQSEPDNSLGLRILQWVAMTKRPLHIQELLHALAIECPDANNPPQYLDEGDILDLDSVLDVCCGLVIIEPNSQLVRLVHFTIEEYFRKNPSVLDDAHAEICRTCLVYLCLPNVERALNRSLAAISKYHRQNYHRQNSEEVARAFVERDKLESRFLFLQYATSSYLEHGQEASIGPDLELLFIRLFKSPDIVAGAFHLDILNNYRFRSGKPSPDVKITALHILAYMNIPKIASICIKTTHDPDPVDIHGRSPLFWAVDAGHIAMATLLLEEGANVNATDSMGFSPLDLAGGSSVKDQREFRSQVEDCYMTMTKLLVERGATINTTEAMARAAFRRRADIVTVLLANGANINIPSEDGETALSNAVRNRDRNLARLLVEAGAQVNSASSIDLELTPLIWAVALAENEIVELLLRAGALVNAQDFDGLAALHWAAKRGHHETAQLLLQRGALVNAPDFAGLTALHWAAKWGKQEMVQLLLQNGASAELMDNSGSTALIVAQSREKHAVVDVFINWAAACGQRLSSGKTVSSPMASTVCLGVDELESLSI